MCRKRPFATHRQERLPAPVALCRIPCLILCLAYVGGRAVVWHQERPEASQKAPQVATSPEQGAKDGCRPAQKAPGRAHADHLTQQQPKGFSRRRARAAVSGCSDALEDGPAASRPSRTRASADHTSTGSPPKPVDFDRTPPKTSAHYGRPSQAGSHRPHQMQHPTDNQPRQQADHRPRHPQPAPHSTTAVNAHGPGIDGWGRVGVAGREVCSDDLERLSERAILFRGLKAGRVVFTVQYTSYPAPVPPRAGISCTTAADLHRGTARTATVSPFRTSLRRKRFCSHMLAERCISNASTRPRA